jgi:hypothetical protein
MLERKAHVVILVEDVPEELGNGFRRFIHEHEGASYLCAKVLEPDENYLHLTLDQTLASGDKVEVVLALPHAYIKATISSAEADIAAIGFPWRAA